jgi:hypothetical protein
MRNFAPAAPLCIGERRHGYRWQAASEFDVPPQLAAEKSSALVVYVLGDCEAELPLSESLGVVAVAIAWLLRQFEGSPDQTARAAVNRWR